MIMDEQKSMGHPLAIHTLLILSVLYSERKVSMHDLVERTHASLTRLKPLIETLIERGVVEEIGRASQRMLMLGQKVYRKTGKTKEYTRQRGIDQVRFPEMILKLAESQNGAITKTDVVELLRVSKPKAYALLQQLCEERKLVLTGRGRYAKYELCQ